MRPLPVSVAVLAWACGSPPTPDDPHTDDPGRVLRDEIVDAPDSAPAPRSDTEPPEPTRPPDDWGGGLVEIAGPVWAARPLTVLPGEPDAHVPPQGTAAFFADLDEDGVPEVVVATVTVGQRAGTWEARVLRWSEGALVDDPALGAVVSQGHDPLAYEAPSAAVDLDGDGHVELLGTSVDQGIRWGIGPGAFGPWTPLLTTSRPRGRALGLADLDADGRLDLLLGGAGCTETAWAALRTGPRTFDVRADVLDGGASVPWAFLVGTLEDGAPLLYVVEEGGCSGQDVRSRWLRRTSAPDAAVPRYSAYDPVPGGAWWQQFPEHAGRTTDDLTPMGAGLDDLDGDGVLDLVVTTGLPRQALLRGVGDGTFVDAFPVYERPSALGFPEFPWSVAFPDLDLDGRPEIVWTIGDDGGSWLALQGHPLRTAVSWNDGTGTLVDVEDAIGLTSEGSWWALGLGDPDADGDADLVVGGEAVPPAVYRDDVDVDGRRGVALRLVGTTSNPLAIGARVEAHVRGLPVRTAAVGFQGARLGTSEPLVFVGAGTEPVVDVVRIRWPTGLVQEVRDLPVGTLHTLVEPAVIEVLDGDRHAPADGTSTVVVRVTPRAVDGEVAATARAEVAVSGAAASVTRSHEGPGPLDATLTAPATPGTSVVTVTLDGVPVEVRPRITWDAP